MKVLLERFFGHVDDRTIIFVVDYEKEKKKKAYLLEEYYENVLSSFLRWYEPYSWWDLCETISFDHGNEVFIKKRMMLLTWKI